MLPHIELADAGQSMRALVCVSALTVGKRG